MRGPQAPPKPFSEARAGGPPPPPPPSPGRGGCGGGGFWGGGNQSCLTADMWFHLVCGNTIPVRSKRSLREGQRSHPEEPPWGATLRSHPEEPPSGATLRSHPQEPPSGPTHPQEPPSGATLEWLLKVSRSPLYTRHIRKY